MEINENTKPYKLTPVKEIPQTKRQKHSMYDEILDDVIANSEKLMKIEVNGRTAKSLYASFKSRIKKRGLSLKIRVRDNILYVEKI
jgi:cell fate regulator YaaT (PSP1 superfamily)